MHPTDRRQFRRGFWATALSTLASRVLGLLRDATTANLLGLATGGVMDAFVLAFRIANVARRLLGEGALATSYLPVLAAELERDRDAALTLAATVLTRLACVLTLVVLAGEAICGLLWIRSAPGDTRLLIGLTAALLPYLWFICLAAQLSATLHALGKFRLPALAATLLNLGWLTGAWWVAPYLAQTATGRAYALAGSIVVAGALQAAIQLAALGRLGLGGRTTKSRMSPFSGARQRFDENSRAAWQRVVRPMGPIALALSVTQFSTMIDSVLAWLLTRPADGRGTIAWLPGGLAYPLQAGATAALYYAERFYQFPVGLLGVAAATVIFPQLSRHAARGDRAALAADLTSGLRLVVCLSLPASVGLILLAEPLARVVLGHGQFNALDVARTASTTRAYAAGIVAYCALPLLLRGFYAVGDARRTLWAAAWALAINTLLDLALAWPLGESGLALATAISSLVQLLLLSASFSRAHATLAWRQIAAGALKAAVAAAASAAAVLTVCAIAPTSGRSAVAVELAAATIAGGLAFAGVLWGLGGDELAMLWPRASRRDESEPATSATPQRTPTRRGNRQVSSLAP
ncbi:MAG TPA: murein biosynthesis integral membrane protein MurJ [Pirellulales bacterium]|jgi:putative peptidoglycan lipid II flippase|nr:murein biosynthesis integral membrane protein MurJ [Pirellulales bacterium]